MKAGDFYIFRNRNYSRSRTRIDVIGILKEKNSFGNFFCYFITPTPSNPERSMAEPSNGYTNLTNGEFILPKEFLL